jgi:hypothetical protein
MRQWKETTRGGYWVRGIEEIRNTFTDGMELRGEVGNHSSEPPSEDPADWARETWRSDGRYNNVKESVLDLMEVQDGE